VIFYPESAISAYAYGSLGAAITVALIYYGTFFYYVHVKNSSVIPFQTISEFLPKFDPVSAETPFCGIVGNEVEAE
jgi:hypothetical protein